MLRRPLTRLTNFWSLTFKLCPILPDIFQIKVSFALLLFTGIVLALSIWLNASEMADRSIPFNVFTWKKILLLFCYHTNLGEIPRLQ